MTLFYLFIFWTILIWLLMKLAKANPLRIVVLIGTFALAMAFAGNDLVNFIGVPLAGLTSYEGWQAAGFDNEMLMGILAKPVKVEWGLLFLAGVIMSITLWVSSKAHRVTETEVNLSRQDEGAERFSPNEMSRTVVKTSLYLSRMMSILTPRRLEQKIAEKFNPKKLKKAAKDQELKAFDLVRASVNLMMASVIIAYATSQKMPLSTTYVSFMVAMGTSLSDKAWGKESAVYRVAGVFSVIGGWLMTALIAFVVSAVFALMLVKFNTYAIIVIVLLVIYSIVFNHLRFKKRLKTVATTKDIADEDVEKLLQKSQKQTVVGITEVEKIYKLNLNGLRKPTGTSKKYKKANTRMKELMKLGKHRKESAIKYIKKLDSENIELGRLYLFNSDLLEDLIQSCNYLTYECYKYVSNLHKKPNKNFLEITEKLETEIPQYLNEIRKSINDFDFSNFEEINQQRKSLRKFVNSEIENQITIVQIEGISTKLGLLQSEILLQTRDILSVALRIYKLYAQFFKDIKPVEPTIE